MDLIKEKIDISKDFTRPPVIIDKIEKIRSLIDVITNFDKEQIDIVNQIKTFLEDIQNQYIGEMYNNARRYKLIFENLNTGIGFSNTKTKKIIELNPRFCEIFEITHKDYENKNYFEFFNDFIIDKNIYEKGKEIYNKGDCKIHGFEIPIKTKNGNQKRILTFSVGIPEIEQEFFTIIDITEQKKLQIAQEEIQHIIQHDIRSPMAGIVGLSNILLDRDYIKTKDKEIIEGILYSGEKVMEMASCHLDLMKMEQGKFKPNYSKISIIEVINNAINSIENGYGKGKILIDEQTTENINGGTNYEILIDEKWIYNMFCNLLKNALEHSSVDGKVIINIEKHENKIVEIKIQNNQTVSEEILEKIFKEKYITFGKKSGHGLGTYSSKLIIESHGGNIKIESNKEIGTIVIVNFKVYGNLID